MIVEFCGIPGGGKSTLARTYAERYPKSTILVNLDMKKKLPEVLYGALFAFRHPVVFFWLIVFVARYHMRGLFWYSFHMAVRASAKYQKACLRGSSGMLFIDEGLVHIICTLSAFPLNKKDVYKWTQRIALADIICVSEEGDFHRFHSAQANLHPRVKRGDAELKNWEFAVKENTSNIVSSLSDSGRLIWCIPSKKSIDFEDKVGMMHEYLNTHNS